MTMMTKVQRKEIYEEGRAAYLKGIGLTKCPYTQYPSQESVWKMGWRDANSDDQEDDA